MKHFCVNPECNMYKYMVGEDVRVLYVSEGGSRRQILRYGYSNAARKNDTFCSVCYEAISIAARDFLKVMEGKE